MIHHVIKDLWVGPPHPLLLILAPCRLVLLRSGIVRRHGIALPSRFVFRSGLVVLGLVAALGGDDALLVSARFLLQSLACFFFFTRLCKCSKPFSSDCLFFVLSPAVALAAISLPLSMQT
ncbi:hypothetical protein EJB05_57237, partial [Eragrostis curvula]